MSDDDSALDDVAGAGLRDLVQVGVQAHDGQGSGGTTVALAATDPIDEVVARLTAAHGEPEVGDEGPPWLQGPRWVSRHEDGAITRGTMVMVVEVAPPFVQAEAVPEDVTAYVVIDRFHSVRSTPAAEADEPARRRRWFRRG